MLHVRSIPKRWRRLAITRRGAARASASAAVIETPVPPRRAPRLSEPPSEGGDAMVIYHGSRPQMTIADWRARGFSTAEAKQQLRTARRSATRVSVVVICSAGVAPLRHYPYHSPDGFEWGYNGSGPADLARCILLDHFGVEPHPRNGFYPPQPDELPVDYQAFKAEVVAELQAGEPWSLTGEQVSEWVAGHR